MDSIWKKEKRQAKNHLEEDSDERAGRDGSFMGRSTGQSTGQFCMAKFLLRPYVPDGMKRMRECDMYTECSCLLTVLLSNIHNDIN